MKNNILFETVVGSHAWKMNKPTSDIDVFRAYVVPTKDILSGILRQNSHFTKGKDRDEFRHEIGVVIEQLIDMNFNFVVGVCSPVINEDTGYLQELKEITERNLAKNIYNSTKGLAIHNYKKYVQNKGGTILFPEKEKSKKSPKPEKELSKEDIQKKLNLIVRSLMFGKWILSHNEVHFTPIVDQSVEDVIRWMKELDRAYLCSELPNKPDPTEFRNFLYKIRIKELEGKI